MLPMVIERLTGRAGVERKALAVPAMIMLSVLGACMTGLLAQVRIPLPFTPVPMTGQTFGVLMCGAFLGAGYGAFSQALYVGAGILGVPWFTGGLTGVACVAGPTGGYLVGFVVAALLLGTLVEKLPFGRSFTGLLALMIAATLTILAFGCAYLMILGLSLRMALMAGVVPFIAGDIIKAVLAAGAVRGMMRR